MREYEYLSDAEIELLILSAMEDEVKAPNDLIDNVLDVLSQKENIIKENKSKDIPLTAVERIERPPRDQKSKKIEFRNYCMKVAALLIVSFISASAFFNMMQNGDSLGKEGARVERKISRQELVKQNENRIFRKNTYYFANIMNQNIIYQSGGFNHETK